mgnify:CR=1 FL=1
MDTYNNSGLLHLSALFIDGSDSHARAGAHLKIAQHPLLGLPVTPFVIERADVTDKDMARLNFRDAALFRDQNGVVRVPPFSIAQGEEITINLPTSPNIQAIWAEIIMDPAGDNEPRARAYLRSVAGEDAYLGQRSGMPLAFTGAGIVRLVLRGVGTVVGLRWLNAADKQKLDYRVVDVLNLPHAGGPRYAALTNWGNLCDHRRDTQTPKRRPMQDTNGAPARAAAPVHNTSEEKERIEAFFSELSAPLNDLITAAPPQLDQVMLRELLDADGNNISEDGSGEIRIRSLGLFLQAQAEPGMASYCGYKTLDRDKLDSSNHRLSLYRLTAVFQNPANGVLEQARERGEVFADLIEAARQGSELLPPQQLAELWNNLAGSFLIKRKITAKFELERRNCMALGGVAVADHRAVLQPMARPALDKPEHQHWLPTDEEDPRRVVETGVRDLVAGSAIAATRRQPVSSAQYFPQNSEVVDGGGKVWRALILPNIPQAGGFATPVPPAGLPDAFISDSYVGPDEFRLYAAQMDRFGRYSDWVNVQGDKGPRPKPPRPVVQGNYRQPDVASGSHRGRVTATVPMPDAATLAPGSYPLSHARLTVTVDGAAFGAPVDLPVTTLVSIYVDGNTPPQPPATPEDDRWAVQTQFDGPVLAALASKKMEITAVWIDTEGQVSTLSEPLRLTMTDPYPPAQLSPIDTLLYAARPDATGKSWVERSLPKPASGTAYAVYYTDENRLRDHLNNLGTPAALSVVATLESETDPVQRAVALEANEALFPGFLFERLKGVTQEIDSAGNMEFRHALSGSLKLLSGYKVVTEATATAARPDLETVQTVFYGVPNSEPPSQPVITARQVAGTGGEPDLVVELTITHRPGVTEARSARLRRTRSGVVDPIRNPVIGTAIFGPVDPDTGLQTATYRDTGSALIAPAARLSPFIKYAWLAEAQGAPEPGSTTPSGDPMGARWSKPSAPVTLDVVPDTAPAAPLFNARSGSTVAGGIQGLEMTFDAAGDLVPTSLGPWVVAVDRRLPDQAMTRITERAAGAGTSFTIAGDPDDATFITPTGTLFRLRLIDPLGRQSPPVDHVI